MAERKDDDMFAQVARRIDPQSTLLRTWTPSGGVSAEVTALEIAHADRQTQKLLIRRHGAADLQHDPHIAADEYTLLQTLHAQGLPVPQPMYLDQSCEIFSTPYLVIEYVEGTTDIAPDHLDDALTQLATQLARIHSVDCSALDLAFLPNQEAAYTQRLRERPTQLDETLSEGRICDALEAVWPLQQHNTSALLHGDYWPGNILWRDGQLVAVLDWEDAALGDPLADLANSRLEILWAYGVEGMQRFTQHYVSLTALDCANLPYWDLCAALRPASKLETWGLDDATLQTMRERHHLFVAQAFEQLAVR